VVERQGAGIALLGGTGDQGLGLALRFAAAGRLIWIGSRKLEPDARVEGLENAEAVRAVPGGVVILSVPFENVVSTVKTVREGLAPDTVVVSMAVPLAVAIGDVASRVLGVAQGSAAELTRTLVPDGIEVVSAFQNVSAHRLMDLDHPVECDVIVSGPKAPRQRVMELCADIPGVRAVDGGPLSNARYVEELTALLIGFNVRYRVREGVGIRITHLP
jgi:NADPH-dependent F420 reductase